MAAVVKESITKTSVLSEEMVDRKRRRKQFHHRLFKEMRRVRCNATQLKQTQTQGAGDWCKEITAQELEKWWALGTILMMSWKQDGVEDALKQHVTTRPKESEYSDSEDEEMCRHEDEEEEKEKECEQEATSSFQSELADMLGVTDDDDLESVVQTAEHIRMFQRPSKALDLIRQAMQERQEEEKVENKQKEEEEEEEVKEPIDVQTRDVLSKKEIAAQRARLLEQYAQKLSHVQSQQQQLQQQQQLSQLSKLSHLSLLSNLSKTPRQRNTNNHNGKYRKGKRKAGRQRVGASQFRVRLVHRSTEKEKTSDTTMDKTKK